MTKEKKIKIRKWSLRIGTGFLAFAAGLASTFFLVPNKVKDIVFDEPNLEVPEETHFSKFVSRIMDTIKVESDVTIEGVTGTIENLKIEWPNNYVKVDGSLALGMKNLDDFDVTVDLGVEYNTKSVDLAVGYTDENFYLAFEDLLLKSSHNNTQDFIAHLKDLFFNPDVPEDQGLGIKVDVDSVLESLLGGLNLDSLLAGGLDGLDMHDSDEIEHDDSFETTLSIALSPDSDPLEIGLFFDKETGFLKCADLKSIAFGDIKISGKVNLDVTEGRAVYAFDDERYVGRRDFKDKKFIEIINYKPWFNNIFTLLNEKTIGLDLDFSVDQLDQEKGAVNIGQLSGGIDVDLSKFNLFDYIPKVIDGSLFSKEDVVTREVTINEEGEETVVEKLLDNIIAGIDLSVDRDDIHYADFNLTYAEQNAYLTLNEDVIKAKIDVPSINVMIEKISALVEGDSLEKARRLTNGEEPEAGPFDFITNSDLVLAIKEGRYEEIVDLIESISSDDNKINLKLNLSSLGLGEDARVELSIGASSDGSRGVTEIKCSDIKMAEGIFQLTLKTRPFAKANIDKILNNKDSYDSLDFVSGVFDQVTNILDTKRSGFAISGSILDDNRLGDSFRGSGQFDYGEKYGFGTIDFINHRNAENPEEESEVHPIKLYVDNSSNNPEENDMKLVYGAHEKLKGKVGVSALEDIIAILGKVIRKQDPRFMKFLAPILKILYESEISKIISSKDWLRFAGSGFIQKIDEDAEGTHLDLLLSPNLFLGFIKENLTIRLNFRMNGDVKELDSIEIINLKLIDTLGGKTISLKVCINDFNPDLPNPVNLNDTFMDFTSIATLLEFGIDSTELNCYHLTAEVDLNLGILEHLVTLQLDFYIEVIGDTTKVFGMFKNIPYVIVASELDDLFASVNVEFLFEPAKHYSTSSTDNIGGYFHILRSETHPGNKFHQYYYRTTSKNFVDNIAQYLLSGVLNFKTSLAEKIGKIDLGITPGAAVYEEMFNENGYLDKSIPSENKYEWDVKMNLDKVSGIAALKSLDAELYGSKILDTNNEERCILNKLHGVLVVGSSNLITISLDATINLIDVKPSVKSWKEDEKFNVVDERFERVCNIYKNVTDAQRETLDNASPTQPFNLVGFDSKKPSIFSL